MHPEMNMMMAKLRHEELTSSMHHVAHGRRTRRRFFRRRRDTVATVVSRPSRPRRPSTSPGRARGRHPPCRVTTTAHSVDDVLSGRAGMSPVMIGRARPFARLAGIVEAAEVMPGDQPAVVLVSGEPGIGKTRLVRELVASLPDAVTTLAATAQPGSMSRALDAVASLVEPADGDLADEVFAVVAAAVQRGHHTARRRGPPLGRRGERQPHRPHRPAAVAEAGHRRHVPPQRPVARPARWRARAAPRTPPRRRAGPPRPPRPHRGQRDGQRHLGGRGPPGVVGVRRGAAAAQQRRPVRRRGADAGGRTRRDGRPTSSTPSSRGRSKKRCASSSRASSTAGGRSSRRWPCTAGRRRSSPC